MEEIKPVGAQETPQIPDAGTGTETPTEDKVELSRSVVKELIESNESSDQALAAAEKKIVALKKQLKSGSSPDNEELVNKIAELESIVANLQADHEEIVDKDLSEIQNLRKKNKELIESVKGKLTVGNSALGTNQSKLTEEVDVLKGFSAEDLAVLKARAARKGQSVEQFVKEKNIKP